MANHKSARKEHRQSRMRRVRNRIHKSRMRTAMKRFRGAMDAGDLDTAKGLLRPTLAMIDHTAKLGVIHDNAAARTKSRLQNAFNKASA